MARVPNMLARVARWFQKYSFLLLRHHPACDAFSDHVFHVKGKAFCIGCFVGYPAMFVTIAFLLLARGYGVPPFILFYTGIAIFTPLMILHGSGKVRRKSVKMASRAVVGAGLGVFVSAILLNEGPLLYKLIFLYLVFQVYLAFIGVYRIRDIGKTCDACPFHADWDRCPGMHGRPGAPGSTSKPEQ